MKLLNILLTVLLITLLPSLGWNDNYEEELYEEGLFAAKSGDYETAFEILMPLALRGDADSQRFFGAWYRGDAGGLTDYQASLRWFRLAAKNGNAMAHGDIGGMYFHGMGVPKDHQMSFKWYKLGAELGDKSSMNQLGVLYKFGWGVTKDIVRAYMWFNIDASLTNETVNYNRDNTELEMTPDQIFTAQTLSTECLQRNFKDC
jgi:uncharacterized protein